ncbi:ApeA N-terminal domain 1-containing protein [Leifsonia aquatica]|uniref:ApeA N-terminal domain 1-containing protein n=1 Tax=Leifsonia aquatica TaxID=144185 RepID=UPI003810380F
MANSLDIGESRIGRLVDFNDTPEVHVQLSRDVDGIEVQVPWISDGSNVYERWFSPNTLWGDDPDKTKFSYEVPSTLVFEDSNGAVTLLGCRAVGFRSNWTLGTGQIRVRFAVFGASEEGELDAGLIGMRASLTNLRQWLGLNSVGRREVDRTDDNRVAGLIRFENPPAIEVPSSPPIRLVPVLGFKSSGDDTTLTDSVQVERRADTAESWQRHRSALNGVRDLLALSRWSTERLDVVKVLVPLVGDDDWRIALDGDTIAGGKALSDRHKHLIQYSDLGAEGIARWIELRTTFARAIDPVISSIYLEGATVEVQLAQVGIGLEALAYLVLLRDDGKTDKEARDTPFKERLDRLLIGMEAALPFSGDGWSQAAADAYNAVKHANRALPEIETLANRWRECVLLFRAWIARELGVPVDAIASRIVQDRMFSPFRLLT